MIKSIMIATLVVTTLIFSGCGDSEGEARLETQQMLDSGNYSGVISKLDSREVKSDEDNLLLGAAYMGKAGLSLSDIIEIVMDSGDSDNGSFATFVDGVAGKRSATALQDLQKSTQYYRDVIGEKCKEANDSNLTLSDSQKDVCLFIGLTETMKAATTISYIADDVSALGNDSNVTDPKLQASACAMQYAFDGDATNINPVKCSVIVIGDYKFASGTIYEEIEVKELNTTKAFNYLLTGSSTPKSTVITDGYCSLDSFVPRVEDKNSTDYDSLSFHVCPVNEDSNATEITTEEVLVDALNNGTDSIGVAADEDMQEDIDEFKCEVLNGVYSNKSCSVSLNQDVTNQDVVDYLNNKNE